MLSPTIPDTFTIPAECELLVQRYQPAASVHLLRQGILGVLFDATTHQVPTMKPTNPSSTNPSIEYHLATMRQPPTSHHPLIIQRNAQRMGASHHPRAAAHQPTARYHHPQAHPPPPQQPHTRHPIVTHRPRSMRPQCSNTALASRPLHRSIQLPPPPATDPPSATTHFPLFAAKVYPPLITNRPPSITHQPTIAAHQPASRPPQHTRHPPPNHHRPTTHHPAQRDQLSPDNCNLPRCIPSSLLTTRQPRIADCPPAALRHRLPAIAQPPANHRHL